MTFPSRLWTLYLCTIWPSAKRRIPLIARWEVEIHSTTTNKVRLVKNEGRSISRRRSNFQLRKKCGQQKLSTCRVHTLCLKCSVTINDGKAENFDSLLYSHVTLWSTSVVCISLAVMDNVTNKCHCTTQTTCT